MKLLLARAFFIFCGALFIASLGFLVFYPVEFWSQR
jgi:hypothetical protein